MSVVDVDVTIGNLEDFIRCDDAFCIPTFGNVGPPQIELAAEAFAAAYKKENGTKFY